MNMGQVIVYFDYPENGKFPDDFWKVLRTNIRTACRHSGVEMTGISTGSIPDNYTLEDPDNPPPDYK